MPKFPDSPPPLKREKFVVPITCKCGWIGSATWKENAEPSPRGPQAVLIGVSDGFYERVIRPHNGLNEIVCGSCETVFPA